MIRSIQRIFTRNMSTNSARFNFSCLRVKEPQRSIDFYKNQFGMSLIQEVEFAVLKKTCYFLAINHPEAPGYDKPFSQRDGVLELVHYWGTEKDPNFKINNGNADPHRGFGHICFSVDNLEVACEELEAGGVKFQKRLSDGRQKDIAFALDPDGYWVELIGHGVNRVENKTDKVNNRLNHTMIRVKDPKKSLEFYEKVFGFKLLYVSEHANAKFTLYFLGCGEDAGSMPKESVNKRQSVLELTHNWGTESDPDFKGYHNGNDDPVGFSHLGISCEDPVKYCADLEAKFGSELKWREKMGSAIVHNLAYILDPDGYSIEFYARDLLKLTPNM